MEHTFSISYSEGGTYVAASVRAPYFCFEASSEEEVVDIARKALDFYHGGQGVVQKNERTPPQRTLVTSHFRHTKTIKTMETA